MEVDYDEFTANARHEAPQNDEQEKEDSTDSQPNKTDEEETAAPADDSEKSEEANDSDEDSEKEDTPFHKHPRWIERQKELEVLRSENEELKGKADEHGSKVADSPYEFEKLFGEDPKVKELYSKMTEKQFADFEERLLAKLESKQSGEREAVQRHEKWIAGQVDALKEAGADFDENKLLKVMNDYKPLDEKGYYDFAKGYEIYQLKHPKVKKEKPNRTVAEKTSGADNEAGENDFYIAAV